MREIARVSSPKTLRADLKAMGLQYNIKSLKAPSAPQAPEDEGDESTVAM